jgi:acyl-CoA synthetase (NDP forming)
MEILEGAGRSDVFMKNSEGVDMEKFFNPRSVAVIGASNSFFNLGATICNILKYIDYKGRVYAVNRRGEAVKETPGFSSVLQIPGEVDLAVVVIASKHVPDTIRECGEKGIRNVIIQSAGFSEEGPDGRELQKKLDEVVKRYDIRYMGPNCLGVLNTHKQFCCFFGIVPGMYDDVFEKPGSVSYIIQSGGVGALVIDSIRAEVSKINKVVSIGNKADVDEADLIEYFKNDDSDVIGMFLENVQNGRKLFEKAKEVEKPILAYKVGKTSEGAKAAMSHTAGMANNDAIFESACRQAGIIRLNSISELYSLPKIFTSMPLLKGNRIAVFTNSGAFGGITADFLVSSGLRMAELSPETQSKLKKTGQLFNASNPVDLGPGLSIQTFIDIFDILLSSDEVDGLLPIPNVWQDVVIDAIAELVTMCEKYGKPAAIYIPNAPERVISIKNDRNLPVFESPEEAVRALTVSYRYYKYLLKKEQLAWKKYYEMRLKEDRILYQNMTQSDSLRQQAL